MGTVNVNLGEASKLNLILGQQLENAVTEVVFDFSAWKTAYGSGTLGLSVQRPGDDQPYAVVMTVSGTDATWSITSLDTAYKGVGEIQVTYTVGSVVKKSVVYKFTVYKSLGENGEYPSPGQSWQEGIEDEIAELQQDFNNVFETNVIFERTAYSINSGTGGTWKSITHSFDDLAVGDVLYIHCGTVTNGTSDRKLSILAYDSSDNYIGNGNWMANSATDITYVIPTGTSYVVLTLFLSRTTAIGAGVVVTFNDLLITKGKSDKTCYIKDSALKQIDVTSKTIQYKTQYMAWESGIYNANTGQVEGSTYFHASLDVVPGEVYKIDGYSFYAILPCIFVDANGNTISKYPTSETSSITRQQFEIEVPKNAVKMYCDAILNYYQAGDIGQWDMRACIVKRKLLTSEYQIEKQLIILGDSWSEKNITASQNYVDYLANDGFDVYNAGVGGTGYRKTYDEGKAWYQRALTLPVDKGNNVLLFGSFNDMSVDNYTLGDIDSTDISTICGCINQTITNIYSRIPLANIMIVSPGTWRWWNNVEIQQNAQKAQAYCNALKTICEKRHIPFYDYYEDCGLRPWDESFANTYYKEGYASNTTHPNDAGQYFYVYPKIREFLVQNCI